MAKKRSASGEGMYSNDVTEGLNRAFGEKIRKNIKASDAWRKAKEDDPRIEFRMSFVDFKRMYFRPKKKLGKTKNQRMAMASENKNPRKVV